MPERYTIGEAAKKLQVSTRTLRFYEEKDLVRPAYTEENGYRFYEKDQIRQLELILFLKELGFSLKQIKMLIQDEHGSQSLELLLKEQYQENQRKIDEISKKQAKIEHLQKIKLLPDVLTNYSGITDIMRKENRLSALRRKMIFWCILLILGELIGISLLYAFKVQMSVAVIGITVVGAIALAKYYYDHVEYVCPNCGDVFIPSFLAFNLAPHTPKFRKLTCPKCGKRSYCLEISRE
ncbi:MerR family transcriptional regulator [Lactobacillus johnsonii]|uniref:MerR family transcriptional regulator n=1 Tax=Lactobacillus johnsonii TaxID=33959 RepID=A0A9X6NZB0_LACJH|nr:MerR family transcriptional regulator [Lactobacillus johnsonii]OYS02259.1 MerR family transcriptional regulator [Lactobacillus johnsonii]OYS05257.1 MerR family transcriptional regulator [Lactobacillus johnsonii]OYS06945.1 MerR family transcriptional regulator [Lactobacillus johnsonii]OYS07415.1 MerR family transcriptional regulator [Lactobacillus johnsonii]OYS11076.1 MerR family transcriptional regulator [Lactobacillus johnsonii]